MLLKHRPPQIDTTLPFEPSPGFEHVDAGEIALLRWLKEYRIDFVLVGSVAQAMQTSSVTAGPLAIVPAPYRRNLERLAGALSSAEARVRNEWALPPGRAQDSPAQISADDLMRERVWPLSCGPLPMDVVGTASPSGSGASAYQELLYEATRVELTSDLSIEVASPEDLEHYAHLRRTGTPPEITISRRSEGEGGGGSEAAGGGESTSAAPERGSSAEAPEGGSSAEAPRAQTHQDGSGRAATGAPPPDSPPGSG